SQRSLPGNSPCPSSPFATLLGRSRKATSPSPARPRGATMPSSPGVMSAHAVHAQLGEVVAGRKPGRVRADEIIVFDSTGTGLQDVAAAIAVYRRALEEKAAARLRRGRVLRARP